MAAIMRSNIGVVATILHQGLVGSAVATDNFAINERYMFDIPVVVHLREILSLFVRFPAEINDCNWNCQSEKH